MATKAAAPRKASKAPAKAVKAPAAALTPPEARFVEQSGHTWATMGLPRMAGRILGYLLICDPPEQSHPGLASVLGASKASISTMTRILMQMGVVERAYVAGDRRDWVRIPDDLPEHIMKQQEAKMREMRSFAEAGLLAIKDAPAARQRRIRGLYEMHVHYETHIPKMLAAWRKHRAGASR